MQNDKPRWRDEKPSHDVPSIDKPGSDRPTKEWPGERPPTVEQPWPGGERDSGVLIAPEPWDDPDGGSPDDE